MHIPASVSACDAAPDSPELGALALLLCLINVNNPLSEIKFGGLPKLLSVPALGPPLRSS